MIEQSRWVAGRYLRQLPYSGGEEPEEFRSKQLRGATIGTAARTSAAGIYP